ncbi:MAG: permease, partial [Gemmataceae bacterium]
MELLVSVLVRLLQTAIESSSTLFVGFFVAAILRRMLGSAGTRRLFGGTGFQGLLRAWFIGSLLPVCSLGVIPVAREMRRAGVPAPTILSFILAAPQLNPLSFLYGLTLSEPIVIIAFIVATMVIAVLGGLLWTKLLDLPSSTPAVVDEPIPAPGMKRLAAVIVSAARDVTGPAMLYAAIGIFFTGVLAGLLPHGCLSMTMRHDDPTSPALMALIGTPAYSGVLPGMMRIGLIFEHGNSVGAAYVLFELGVGFNVGLILWMLVNYHGWRALLWIGLVVGLVLAAAYGMEKPLYFAKEEASHTHAFDEWTSPFTDGYVPSGETVRTKILQKFEVLEPVAIAGLALFGIIGVVLFLADRVHRLEAFLLKPEPPPTGPQSVWNRGVPGPVLGLVALL